MRLDSSRFRGLNTLERPEWMGCFSLQAPPNTDLWRKPPSRDTATAPVLYTCLRNPFVAAEVTVAADWELEWDQGGLVIFAGTPPPGQRVVQRAAPAPVPSPSTVPDGPASSTVSPAGTQASCAGSTATTTTTTTTTTGSALMGSDQAASAAPPPAYSQAVPASKWVKAGLEYCNGSPHASSVSATSDGADWALAPLSSYAQAHRFMDLRVKLERIGYALWVWFDDGSPQGWQKLREVTWFFWGVEDKAVRVGVYASRPANFGNGPLGGAGPIPDTLLGLSASSTPGLDRGASTTTGAPASGNDSSSSSGGDAGGGGGGGGGGEGEAAQGGFQSVLVVEFDGLQIF